jgi:hypothetical protein
MSAASASAQPKAKSKAQLSIAVLGTADYLSLILSHLAVSDWAHVVSVCRALRSAGCSVSVDQRLFKRWYQSGSFVTRTNMRPVTHFRLCEHTHNRCTALRIPSCHACICQDYKAGESWKEWYEDDIIPSTLVPSALTHSKAATAMYRTHSWTHDFDLKVAAALGYSQVERKRAARTYELPAGLSVRDGVYTAVAYTRNLVRALYLSFFE